MQNNTPTATQAYVAPTTEFTAMPSCDSEIIHLSDLTDGKSIDVYDWREGASDLYIQSDGNWLKYSIQSKSLVSVSDSESVRLNSPYPVELIYRSILDNDPESWRYTSSLSPSGTQLIYWKPTKLLPIPTLTPESSPNDLSDESIQLSDKNVYLLHENDPEPLFLGRVTGGIKSAHWLPGERKIILEMLPFSPHYPLLLDIPAKSLSPILSANEISSAQRFALLGISPDGNQAMYQVGVLPDYTAIKNIKESDTEYLYWFPRTSSAWWLPDGKRIVTILAEVDHTYSIFLVNSQTGDMFRVFSSEYLSKRDFIWRKLSILDDEAILISIRGSTWRNSSPYEIDVLHVCFTD
jgi:hypothetical protein